jgi:hypothetical protein
MTQHQAGREIEVCATCFKPLPHGYMACDETMGSYCADCWPAVQCEKRHGEGCATAVWCTPDCPSSPTGKHQVDTSMESGPNNCFHCERPMQ